MDSNWVPETTSGVSGLLLTIAIHNEYHYLHVLSEELSQPKLSKLTEARPKSKPSDPNFRAALAFTTPCRLPSELM